ncbi:MAG TPA: hypothetical protein H9822_09460 [Candidatus Yaniella excrementavium]|nr:hypothetical protein [Candidatus Yaniella excrementavium]
MTTHTAGVFVTHNPVGAPSHHMCLTLWNHTQTTRARVVLDGPPRGYLAYMPTAIEGRFMSIVCIERYGVQIAGR